MPTPGPGLLAPDAALCQGTPPRESRSEQHLVGLFSGLAKIWTQCLESCQTKKTVRLIMETETNFNLGLFR